MILNDLKSTVRSAISAGLRLAERRLLNPERSIQADTHSQISLAAQAELFNLLLTGIGDAINSPDEPIDREAHEAIFEVIRDRHPGAVIIGQKATEGEWHVATQADNCLLFLVDSIDGVLPYLTLTYGYSTNLLVYIRENGHDKLAIAAIGVPGGRCLMWQANAISHMTASAAWGGAVTYGLWNEDEPELWPILSEPLHSSESAKIGVIAAVAGDPTHRRQIAPLLDLDSRIVFTTGGAPASLGLITGVLESLVATEPQALYDVAHIPILMALGVPIFSLVDGSQLTPTDVAHAFEGRGEPRYATSQPLTAPFPPFVATRSPGEGARLAELLAGQ